MEKECTVKYEPKSLDEMVLNSKTRAQLKKIFEDVPNTILYSSPGMGKGVFAIILLKDSYDNNIFKTTLSWL